VGMVVTELAVFSVDRNGGGVVLLEMAPGVTVDQIRANTEASFSLAPALAAA
jgi:3-oxoacid CoA-transferase subunit B